jgi:hypothetical protein
MAITIYTEPAGVTSPYRPVYFDCSSDLGTITSMIADVYTDGSLVSTIDVDPILGETDQFRIEIGEVLKKQLTSEFNESVASLNAFDQTTSAKQYYVRLFEVYTSGSVLDTSWTEEGAGVGYEQSSTLYTHNLIFQHEQKDTASDYALLNSSALFQTNRPQLSNVSRAEFLYFGGTIVPSNPQMKFQLDVYTGANGGGSSSSTTSSNVQSTNRKVNYCVDVSAISTTRKSLGVTAYDSTSTQRSAEFIVNIIDSCDDDVIMYWQNHYGFFDSYTFRGRYREKTKNKKRSIEKRLALDYAISDRGETDISNENERSFEIYSQTESKAVIKWLAEIGESVDVRIKKTIDGSIEFLPVNVTSVSSTIEDSDRVIHQIKVNYKLSNKRINQLG